MVVLWKKIIIWTYMIKTICHYYSQNSKHLCFSNKSNILQFPVELFQSSQCQAVFDQLYFRTWRKSKAHAGLWSCHGHSSRLSLCAMKLMSSAGSLLVNLSIKPIFTPVKGGFMQSDLSALKPPAFCPSSTGYRYYLSCPFKTVFLRGMGNFIHLPLRDFRL